MSLLARLTKREPKRSDRDWGQRTYPCRRWFCFRRSPAWRSFKRGGKSWCDRHIPLEEAAAALEEIDTLRARLRDAEETLRELSEYWDPAVARMASRYFERHADPQEKP